MAEDTPKDETPTNTISISIEEYNRLKAKDGHIQKLESQISEFKTTTNNLASELETVKSSKIKTVNKEEIEEQVRREFGERLTAAEQRALENEKKFKTAVVTDRVLNELQKEKLLPWAADYIRRDIERDCDIDGDSIIIKDEKGQPRWSKNTPDKRMDVTEYVQDFKSKAPQMFGSNAREGVPEGGESRGTTNKDFTKLTWDEVQKLPDAEIAKIPVKILDDLMNNSIRGNI